MTKKILILAPHADDEVLGCGGLISKYKKDKYLIYVLILTNANKGAPELFSATYIKNLRHEARKANKVIGTTELIFENLPALNLNNIPLYKISNLIHKYISKINPEIILLPSNNDIHEDHKIVFKAAKVALRPNQKTNINKILTYEVLSETEWNENEKSFNPNYFIKLKKHDIDKKIKAFQEYKSQIKKIPHPRSKDAILSLAKLRGSQANMLFAEAFKVEKIFN